MKMKPGRAAAAAGYRAAINRGQPIQRMRLQNRAAELNSAVHGGGRGCRKIIANPRAGYPQRGVIFRRHCRRSGIGGR